MPDAHLIDAVREIAQAGASPTIDAIALVAVITLAVIAMRATPFGGNEPEEIRLGAGTPARTEVSRREGTSMVVTLTGTVGCISAY
jgi:hypothetical protein